MYDLGERARRLSGNPVDSPAWRFGAGAEQIALSLASKLPNTALRLGAHVASVCLGNDDVCLKFGSNTLRAGQVILALPPALAAHNLEFVPPLPEPVQRLISSTPVWMGAVTKVVAVYREAFWRRAGLAGAVFSPHGPLREVHDMCGKDGRPAALFGFATSESEAALTEEAVLQQLTRVFGARQKNGCIKAGPL